MSPESIQDPDSVDARSDLYAVGAVGYFLLTGTPVFAGRSAVEVCTHHVQTSPERPCDRIGKPIAEDLAAIILSCLEKDRDARPASAREIAAALDLCHDAQSWTDGHAERWWKNRGGTQQRHEFEFGGPAGGGATLISGQGDADETR